MFITSLGHILNCIFVSNSVVYSDEAVEKLLDRSQEGEIEKEKEKEFGMNEYLRSFKVASYQVKEGVDAVNITRHFYSHNNLLSLFLLIFLVLAHKKLQKLLISHIKLKMITLVLSTLKQHSRNTNMRQYSSVDLFQC